MDAKHQRSRRAFTRQLGMCVAAAGFTPRHLFAENELAPSLGGVWNPVSYGAVGDGHANDTAAVQRAIEACAAGGGGTVVLPAGRTFLCGTVVLRPHVALHLAGGTTLLASTERADFHEYGALLFAKDAIDIQISGTGTINGNCAAYFGPKGPNGYAVPQPFLDHTIRFTMLRIVIHVMAGLA